MIRNRNTEANAIDGTVIDISGQAVALLGLRRVPKTVQSRQTADDEIKVPALRSVHEDDLTA